MSETINNSGFMATGNSTVHAGNIAVGRGARIVGSEPAPQRPAATRHQHGIGVITIKPNETRAVVDTFGLTRAKGAAGERDTYRGSVHGATGPVDLVAIRALQQGQRSMMATLAYLRQHVDPAIYVIVGIGGGINDRLVIGDVVVANRVIYYDLRRETPDGVRHRGEARDAPAVITHAVNSFFDDHGEPAKLDAGPGRPFRVRHGPIGSGDALVTDAESWIRKFLLTYNEFTLAVDMEAAALTQFCHEAAPPAPGWLVIRGISDLADAAKNEDHQASAARNAAITLQHLLPYLPTGT